jgi:tetratricopeptide (TPR) repeat protein
MVPEKALTVPPLTPAPPVYTFGQLWQVPLFLLALVAVPALWATRPLWYDPETVHLRRDLAQARSLLQDPHAALNGLTVLLSEALSHISRLPDRAGETHFLLGTAYLRLAEQVPAERAADLWRKARSHLEQAEQLGVPEGDRASLVYRLGKAWYHAGGDVQRVIDYLSRTIDQVEDDRAAGYEMLTQCYLRLPVPNLPAALQANEKQLQLPTEDSRLVPARLLRGELLLRLQQREAARKVLVRIGPGAPPALLARARYLRAHSYQEEEAWAEAAKLWEEVLADRRQPPADASRIAYFLGWCYRNLNRRADAARSWEPAAQQGGEEGQAASLRLANVHIETGNISAALELYDRALGTVRQAADYHNSLVTPLQVANLLAADCRACKDAGKFEAAEKLALLNAKLTPPGPAQVLLGQVAQAWAGDQHARAQQLKDSASAQQEEEAARSHFRAAAAAYAAAAAASAGQPEQGEWLWHAGACSMQGQDFAQAITAYDRLVKLRPPLARLSEAWYRLGEAQQALHQDSPAADAYKSCIETGGPFAYRARYQLAMSEIGRGNFNVAEEILDQNLLLMAAEPEREAHDRTLYALADLLFLRRIFWLAAKRWEEALRLYPTSPTALTARYRLALSYRSLADRESQDLRPNDPPNTQPPYRRQFALWLEKAGVHFQKLVDDLQARQAAAPLAEADATLLRQARFALADCRFDQRLYPEAIPLYISLKNEPQAEGLMARKQLYRCYVESTAPEKPEENLELARRTLEEMRLTLKALDDAAFQGRPETEGRAAWESWLKTEEVELLKTLRSIRPQS